MDGVAIKEGDILGISDGKIISSGKDAAEVLADLTEKLVDDDSEFLNVYFGADVQKEDADRIKEEFEEKYPDLEVSVKYGGQPLYYYIVSVE